MPRRGASPRRGRDRSLTSSTDMSSVSYETSSPESKMPDTSKLYRSESVPILTPQSATPTVSPTRQPRKRLLRGSSSFQLSDSAKHRTHFSMTDQFKSPYLARKLTRQLQKQLFNSTNVHTRLDFTRPMHINSPLTALATSSKRPRDWNRTSTTIHSAFSDSDSSKGSRTLDAWNQSSAGGSIGGRLPDLFQEDSALSASIENPLLEGIFGVISPLETLNKASEFYPWFTMAILMCFGVQLIGARIIFLSMSSSIWPYLFAVTPLISIWVMLHIKRIARAYSLYFIGNSIISMFVFECFLANYWNGGKGHTSLIALCIVPMASLLMVGTFWTSVWTCFLIMHSLSLYYLWTMDDSPYTMAIGIPDSQLLISIPFVFLISLLSALRFRSFSYRYISMLKSANEALSAARDEAMESAHLKAEFLACMSHEIRTPLNGIIGMLQLALNSNNKEAQTEQPEQREYMQTAFTSAEALLGLLNDILDFSKIEAHQMAFDRISFSLRDTVSQAVKTFAATAHQKKLELVCTIHPELNDSAFGDPHRFRQIISNLISNALKFTLEGEVCIKLTPAEVNALHIAVADTGIGIESDKLDRIFEPYKQEKDSETSRVYGGTGLGLTVVKRLVELFEGNIWIESQVGQGTTFHVVCKLFEHNSALVEHDHHASSSSSESDFGDMELVEFHEDSTSHLDLGLRDRESVLLISASHSLKRSIADMLSDTYAFPDRPYAFEYVQGEIDQVQKRLHRTRPAFAILDTSLPDSITSILSELLYATHHVTGVVFLCKSTQMLDISAKESRKRANVSFLMKPVFASDLKGAFERLAVTGAHRTRSRSRDRGSNSTSPRKGIMTIDSIIKEQESIPDADSEASDTDSMAILLVDDNAVNLKVGQKMLSRLGHNVYAFQDAQKAIAFLEERAYNVDCIFMDIQMFPTNGMDATRLIRQRESALALDRPLIPVIALTASAYDEERNKLYQEAGMQYFLSKPLHFTELVHILDVVQYKSKLSE